MKKLLLITLLASCAQKELPPTSRLHQPDHLILAPNTVVKTVDGDYISNPVNLEIWHSAASVEKLEKLVGEFK